MDVTAVTNSINKKQMNSGVKRSHSTTNTLNNTLKYVRRTKNDLLTTNVNKKTHVYEYFLQQRPFTNIQIKLIDDIIWCDKALLATASSILCEQLVQMNSNDDILVFDDIHLDEFLLFLEFIYPIFNPEINQENISVLIQLSHRFQFHVLKHACQFYVMKYLSTIRNVLNKSDTNDENENSKKYDLIEFQDGTCIDACEIILNLCEWLRTYFYEDNKVISQSIMSILQQISIENLDHVMNSIDMNSDIQLEIYKQRAQYLEKLFYRI